MNEVDLQKIEEMSKLSVTENERLSGAKKPGFLRFFFLLLFSAALAAGLYYFSQNKKAPAGGDRFKKDKDVLVRVTQAASASVPVEIKTIGNALPYSVVNIVPQVSGQLVSVHFKQGDFVKKGDLLFQIDSAPFEAARSQVLAAIAKDEAQIQQAEATLARDRAQLGQLEANMNKDKAQAGYASKQNKRYKELLSQGAVSHEQTDQMATNLAIADATIEADLKQLENAKSVLDADRAAIKTAQGQLQADKAALRSTEIQLGWTSIRSPITGKTSSLNVYEGNIVTAHGSQSLLSIAQIKPIYVTFAVPEQHLDRLRKSMHEGTLRIQADIGGIQENAVLGKVSFLENTVNTSTGTINMRASFENEDQKLFPGQFVDVTLRIPASADSIVVPNSAIQTTQSGPAVFLITSENKAVLCPVEIERSAGELSAVKGKIKAGDQVVVDGAMQLSNGSKVRIAKGARASLRDN